MRNDVWQSAHELTRELSAIRRDFHKYAESGWLEMRTSSIIAGQLNDMGYEVVTGPDVCKGEARMGVPNADVLEKNFQRAVVQGADKRFIERTKDGFTGVIGILKNGDGPTVALRFDIDALDLQESQDEQHRPVREGFSSVNPGMMHACGHDGHAAIGLGVAKLLMEFKDQFKGTVKLIFQPAEEGLRGAKSIVANGHLDDVVRLLSCHIAGRNPEEPDSQLMTGFGGGFASVKYDAFYTGKAAHAAAAPECGRNAMLAAATAVLNLYAMSRHSSSDTRINVGVLHAGSGRNVIPDSAVMQLEVRGRTDDSKEFLAEYAKNIIKSAAEMHNVAYTIKVMGEASSMESSPDLMQDLAKHVHAALPEVKICSRLRQQQGGSEDFAYMMTHVQNRSGKASMLPMITDICDVFHGSMFDFDDEDLLPRAAAILTVCTIALIQDILE